MNERLFALAYMNMIYLSYESIRSIVYLDLSFKNARMKVYIYMIEHLSQVFSLVSIKALYCFY